MIPLNQLIPECLLALGGAFLLGNLAAYIRLRPAWRDAKRGHGGQAAKRNGKAAAGTKATAATEATARTKAAAGTKATARPGRADPTTGAGQRLPSRARVLTNVLIGLVISVAALATLLRG